MTDLQTLRMGVRDGVCWVALDRPEVLNTISRPMLQELRAAFVWMRTSDEVRVAVLTGCGRAFCAGADLAGISLDTDGAALLGFLTELGDVFQDLRSFPKPLIGAINGTAAGGGLELALCCDFVLARSDARFSDAHANIGAIPGGGSCALLPRRVGPSFAKYMIFSGEWVSAEEMRDLGFVCKTFAPDEFEQGVQRVAARIACNSAEGVATSKRVVDQGLALPSLNDALAVELAANAEHVRSADFIEGVRAFREKRKPQFNQSNKEATQ